MAKLNTVNVIEYCDNCVQSVASFLDEPSGNKEAEGVFARLAKARHFSKKDIKLGLEEGYLVGESYELYLTHSQ